MSYDKEKQSEYQLNWMNSRRDEWINENGPCAECKSSEDLEVDHIDPETKTWEPAQIWSRKKEDRDKELAKCQVLCHDCHLEKTKEFLSSMWSGELSISSKLSEDQVKEIRTSSLSGVQLAQIYGVHKTTISDIRLYKTWKHI